LTSTSAEAAAAGQKRRTLITKSEFPSNAFIIVTNKTNHFIQKFANQTKWHLNYFIKKDFCTDISKNIKVVNIYLKKI